MANYYGNTRTNYFRVRDEKAFKEVMESIVAYEDSVEYWEKEIDGETYYAFGAHDSIAGVCECAHCNSCKDCENEELESNEECTQCECEGEYSYEAMTKALQKVVHPEDAIIITSVGNEKLRYVGGCSTIITKEEIKHVDLWSSSIESAREILKNDKYNTSYSC